MVHFGSQDIDILMPVATLTHYESVVNKFACVLYRHSGTLVPKPTLWVQRMCVLGVDDADADVSYLSQPFRSSRTKESRYVDILEHGVITTFRGLRAINIVHFG